MIVNIHCLLSISNRIRVEIIILIKNVFILKTHLDTFYSMWFPKYDEGWPPYARNYYYFYDRGIMWDKKWIYIGHELFNWAG